MNRKLNQFIKYLATAVAASAVTFALMMWLNYEDIYFKRIIENNFYGDVDITRLENASRSAMVQSLNDKHSVYIDEEYGFENFTGQATGNYTGVGISIVLEGENVIIKYVMPDSPAEKAGLLDGDIISAVDGKSTKGLDTQGVSDLVRGEKGTKLDMTVIRNGEEKTFKVERDFISSASVTSKKFGDIGYVHMSQFDDDAHKEMQNKIDEMGEIKGLIIDLRDNPGGLLTTAVSTLDMFINEGKFITIKYKKGNKEDSISASGKQIYKMPLVVLTNEHSASASELFTAAIRDNKRGISVGKTTYGKGSVQRSFPLGKDRGINLTIARFFSPNGNEINDVGVVPDVEVEIAEAYRNKSVLSIPADDDAQLQAALKQFK